MEIMVTFPADPVEREALSAQAALLHAEAICAALRGLSCPTAQKTDIFHALKVGKDGNGRSNGSKL